jgi:hypothetical protein
VKHETYLDVGPALLVPGYRVALMVGWRCAGQAIFDTANDVAAAASLAGLAVLTDDDAVAQACKALGVATALPPPVRQEAMAI